MIIAIKSLQTHAYIHIYRGSLETQMVKNLPGMEETQV